MRLADKSRFVIVKSSVGAGLGDRIRAVLAGILYARCSGRNLKVMWDDGLYGPEGQNVFSHLFFIKGMCSDRFDPTVMQSTRPAFWAGQLTQPMKVLYRRYGPASWDRREVINRFSFDQSQLDYDEDVLIMWEFDQFGTCLPRSDQPLGGATWSNHAFVSGLAKKHLELAETYQMKVECFKRSHFAPQMIGVHVRKSSEEKAKNKQIGELRYHHRIRRLLKNSPDAGIFLATDNAEIEVNFRNKYGDAVVTTDKWFGNPGEALHLTDNRENKLDNIVEALMDMFLLASCDYLVYPANSSFSMVASYFSDVAEENIYSLQPASGVRSVVRKVLEPLGR